MSKLVPALAISFLFLIMSFSLNAQTKETPNAIGFKVLFLDYFTPNTAPTATLDDISNGFELSYQRHLTNSLNLSIPLRMGVIDLPSDIDNKSFVGLDALLNLKFYKEKNM